MACEGHRPVIVELNDNLAGITLRQQCQKYSAIKASTLLNHSYSFLQIRMKKIGVLTVQSANIYVRSGSLPLTAVSKVFRYAAYRTILMCPLIQSYILKMLLNATTKFVSRQQGIASK